MKLIVIALNVLDENMIVSFWIIENTDSVLPGHVLSHEAVNIIMKEIISKNLRSVCLDDGIHLRHGEQLRKIVRNLGAHFCTQSTSKLLKNKREGSRWFFCPPSKKSYFFLVNLIDHKPGLKI